MSWTLYSVYVVCVCALARTQVIPGKSRTNDGDFNNVNSDGSFDFGYANKDVGGSYHLAQGNINGVVGGRFGARDPGNNEIKETIYTAGPRGFRARGPNVHRKIDLDQRPRGNIGNKDDPYFDPSEDPSYSYKIDTRSYSKNENADSRGDVTDVSDNNRDRRLNVLSEARRCYTANLLPPTAYLNFSCHYTFVDDIGERHDVSYIAGRDTGFHVSSANPDAPNLIGSPFHRAPLVRGEDKPRGKTAVQRGLDGSYRFISAGPDQRRTESSDSHGNVRGSYTFLDDKGVQRSVHYIAGPGIGYRIVKNSNDPIIPPYFPTLPSSFDPAFNAVGGGGGSVSPSYTTNDEAGDDVFKGPDGTAASGHVKPPPFPSEIERPSNQVISPPEIDDSDNGPSGETFGPGPTFVQEPGSDGVGYVDEDASSFPGPKPTQGPGKPWRPTSKPYRPTKKPYVPVKPSQGTNNKHDEYEVESGEQSKPEYAVGFNIHPAKPGATIIRNIGEEYFGIPPGVSVRAHVQSIDLYPFGSKPLSPSEALENDQT